MHGIYEAFQKKLERMSGICAAVHLPGATLKLFLKINQDFFVFCYNNILAKLVFRAMRTVGKISKSVTQAVYSDLKSLSRTRIDLYLFLPPTSTSIFENDKCQNIEAVLWKALFEYGKERNFSTCM